MSDIITVTQHLPDNIQDLSKFVLVGREKLTSVRAEIRAIDKLNLAEEVRSQKREEAQMLSEALLDAEVRIGELLKQIPKDSGGDRRSSDFKNLTSEKFEKPKLELAKELGFDHNQVHRFETLASNKDIVERVKAEARENEDIPTRSRVLQLVKEKNKPVKSEIDPDFKYHATRSIHEAISCACLVKVDRERLFIWLNSLQDAEEQQFQLGMINDAIENLRVIKAFITKEGDK